MLNRFVISMNKVLGLLRWRKAEPGEVLLLLPHCLQNKSCTCDLTLGIEECRRCGKCAIKDVSILRDEYQIRALVVGGGQQAVLATRDKNVRLVIAVACEKELAAGILAVFRKPIMTIPNKQPFGPCVNTDVDLEAVRATLEKAVKRPE